MQAVRCPFFCWSHRRQCFKPFPKGSALPCLRPAPTLPITGMPLRGTGRLPRTPKARGQANRGQATRVPEVARWMDWYNRQSQIPVTNGRTAGRPRLCSLWRRTFHAKQRGRIHPLAASGAHSRLTGSYQSISTRFKNPFLARKRVLDCTLQSEMAGDRIGQS